MDASGIPRLRAEARLSRSAAPGMRARGAPGIRPFARSLPMQLLRVREALMQHFRPHLRAQRLTDQQWRVVRALAEAPSMEISEVGARCSIHAASLSIMLPRLAAAGIISRSVDRRDQRRTILALTPKGERLFRTMGAESEAIYRRLRRRIGAGRVEALYRLLDDVLERLAEGDAPERRRKRRSNGNGRAA